MNLVAGLFACGGAGFLALGLSLRGRTRRFIARALRTEASAEAVVTRAGLPGAGASRHTRLGFVDAAGRRHTVESRLGLPNGAYARGRRVEVLYDPADPTDAVVASWPELHAPWLIFSLLGAGWLVAGLAWLIASA